MHVLIVDDCAALRALMTRILRQDGFAASAWQCAPRDRYIGWSAEQRTRNLHLIVNNARFLILPWIRSKNPELCSSCT